MSPPEREKPAPPQDRPSHHYASDSHSTQELPRRRAASRRLPVLDCRRSDPWYYQPPVAGYPDAAAHLLELGLTPAPDIEGLRQMWRRGSCHRRDAARIAQAWELTV